VDPRNILVQATEVLSLEFAKKATTCELLGFEGVAVTTTTGVSLSAGLVEHAALAVGESSVTAIAKIMSDAAVVNFRLMRNFCRKPI
jgi:hypothetical protein